MSKHQSWTRIQRVALLAASAALLPACGGSAEFSAGAGGTAGAANGAASGGDQSGGNQSGGNGATAGNPCGVTACPAIGCGPGYQASQSAGECCPVCVPDGSGGSGGALDCFDTSCPANQCAKGMKLQPIAGECCSSCVPDPDACSEGQAGYVELIDGMLTAPGVLSCATDADCIWVEGSGQCDEPCLPRVANVTSNPSLQRARLQFETDYCSTCTRIEQECASSTHPACSNGSCVLQKNE